MLDEAHSEGQLSMVEHQQRITAAMAATTLGDLDKLVADLQLRTTYRPVPPAGAGSTRTRVLIAAAVVAGLGITGWLLTRGDEPGGPATPADHPMVESPTAESPVTGAPSVATAAPPDDIAPTVLTVPRYLDTVAGMTGVLDEIAKRFGSTMGFELALTPERAHLSLPDPADERRRLLYTFRGGWDQPQVRPRSDSDQLTDLAAFDVPAAVAAWRAAPQTLGIAADDVADTYFDVDHVAAADGGDGALEVLIRVSARSGPNGYIFLDPAGNVLRIEKPS